MRIQTPHDGLRQNGRHPYPAGAAHDPRECERERMKKKAPRPEGIPLETLFADKRFQRNYEMLMSEPVGASDPALKKAITSELTSNATENVAAKRKHARASSKGGESTARLKGSQLKDRNDTIAREAESQRKAGKSKHELPGILAKRHGLSSRQIRNILNSTAL